MNQIRVIYHIVICIILYNYISYTIEQNKYNAK